MIFLIKRKYVFYLQDQANNKPTTRNQNESRIQQTIKKNDEEKMSTKKRQGVNFAPFGVQQTRTFNVKGFPTIKLQPEEYLL